MVTQDASQHVTMGLELVWTLVTRSIGLTAGMAVALLLISALLTR